MTSPWWHLAAYVVAALALVWVLGVVLLVRAGAGDSRSGLLRESLRLVPDLLRLLRRLAADPTLPRGVRVRLVLMLGYLALPIDLVPDFVPVAGVADDVILLALTLRSVVRRAGPEALDRHWPGTPHGLETVRRLAGLPVA